MPETIVTRRRMLVTGGSGYLGGWVARLARREWEVTATYLSRAPGEQGAYWRRLDVREQAAVAALVGELRPAVVVHTAAANPGGGADPRYEATNTVGTHNVARTAAACGARLIHISSDVLFDGEKGNYVEEDPPKPITPYGRSKALAEEAVRDSGARALIVRTSLIYGWRPRVARQIRWMAETLRAGRELRLFTDELRCPIWVESLAAAVVELAGLDLEGVLHVAGAQALSRYAFGVRVLGFLGFDTGSVVPASSRSSGLVRPLDCTLDSSRARALLRTPLPGVDGVLARHG